MTAGTVRYHRRIRRDAEAVWALAGDPARLSDWFPGIVQSVVDGTRRLVVLASGLPMPEEILTVDPILRRFQYRITAPVFVHHRGTIEVLDLDDGTCVVTYTTEADPRSLALTIGAATAGALDELARIMERGEGD